MKDFYFLILMIEFASFLNAKSSWGHGYWIRDFELLKAENMV